MLIVEFIGPSGVGKSFLCNELIKRYNTLISNREALVKIAEKKYKNRRFDSFLFFLRYLRFSLFKNIKPFEHKVFELSISILLEKKIEQYIKDQYNDLISCRLHVLSHVLSNNLYSDKNFFLLRSMKIYYDLLLVDAIINYYAPENTILFEEGILHGTAVYHSFNLKNFYSSTNYKSIFKNRIFINVYGPLDTVVSNFKQRESLYDTIVTDEDINKIISKQIEIFHNVSQQLKTLNESVLDIDITNNIDDNVELIINFINKINA